MLMPRYDKHLCSISGSDRASLDTCDFIAREDTDCWQFICIAIHEVGLELWRAKKKKTSVNILCTDASEV